MPKVNLGGIDFEKKFGAKLNAKIVETRQQRANVAKRMGVCDKTLKNRFDNPGQMTLFQLKQYIKATGIEKETVIEYLYEGK